MKKPFYKKWWFWVIVVIVVAAAAGGSGGEKKDQAKATSAPAKETKQEAPKQETPKQEQPKQEAKKEEPKNKPGISKSEFDQIQNGMPYEEVKNIIGSDGEVLSEVGQKGEQFYTIMYKWDGEKGLGANANFTFQDGKLQSKAQFGLK